MNQNDIMRIGRKGYETAMKCQDCDRMFAPDERDEYESHMIEKHSYPPERVKKVANELEFEQKSKDTVDSRTELREVLENF